MFEVPENPGVGEFHHLAIAVKDIEQSMVLFQAIGFQIETQIYEDLEIDVNVQFFKNSSLRIELVEPRSDSSPANVWLRAGSPIYHIAYVTEDFEHSRGVLQRARFRKIFGPSPAVAFKGKSVEFYMNSSRLVIELIER